jgi:molybdate transport repressor ModE-like protein
MTGAAEGAREVELRTIRILHAIEREGSITAAAQVLGFSQPAVSQHLQRAETRIGMPLITRLGRNVKLTEAGTMIAAIAPSVLAEVDSVLTRLEGLTQLRSGHVRMLGFPSASSTLVPTVLNDVRTARPGISIAYTESQPHDALHALSVGECDIALVCGYGVDSDAETFAAYGVEATPIFIDPLYAVLPRDHPLADEPTVNLIDLEDDDWIGGWHAEEVCRKVGFTPKVSMTTDNFIAVLGLVARGFGVSILPRLPLTTAAIPRGCVIRPTNPQEFRTIHIATTPERAALPAVRLTSGIMAALDGSPWKLHRPGSVTV